MKTIGFLFAGLALVCSGVAFGAMVPTVEPKPTPQAQGEAEESEADGLDMERLLTDSDYAEALLAALDEARKESEAGSDAQLDIDRLRVFALSGAGRKAEATGLARRLVAARPAGADAYALLFLAGLLNDQPAEAVWSVEQAVRTLPEGGRKDFAGELSEESVLSVWRLLHEAKDDEGRYRYGEALLALGWQGEGDLSVLDIARSWALKGRLKRGDLPGARTLAQAITTPRNVVELLTARIYDPLFGPEADRLALLRARLDAYDRLTAERVRGSPGNFNILVERAAFLRSLGKEKEALELLAPTIADMAKVRAGGEYADWALNEAAYAQAALGRHDEAVRLIDRLAEPGLEKNSNLINMLINRLELLNAAGRHSEAIASAARLEKEGAEVVSPYGSMWIWAGAACAHAFSGDQAGARKWIARLQEKPSLNEAAHMRALLCAGDLDAAERALIGRLESQDPYDTLVAVQDYTLGGALSPRQQLIADRLKAVAARPAVQAAIAKVGRILPLPLSRNYWGEF